MQRASKMLLAFAATFAFTFSACARGGHADALQDQSALEPTLELQLWADPDALRAASAHIGALATPPPLEDDDLRTWLLGAVEEEDWARARLLRDQWLPLEGDLDAEEALLKLLIEDQDFESARARAWSLLERFPDAHERWVPLWYEGFFADESFWRSEPYSLEAGVDFDKLDALGGGSTVTLKVILNDEIVGVLKPHSTREQSYYRGEVAAYRLCALMRCSIEVPKNTEVRIRVRDFLRAYGISSLQNRTGYSRHFRDLITFEDEDGEAWIHATLKAWAPGFTSFPLEHTQGWLSLVNGAVSVARLEQLSLADVLRPFRGVDRAYVPAMLNRAGDTTAVGFATQLSDMHVFDYLLNNWDRYSDAFPGVNCQWNHGRFVSIDNGAVLQLRRWGSSAATRSRMRQIRMFSAETIAAIRWMDRDLTRALLLPENPHHADEDERFENFWERRNELLEWLDTQIERRGVERTLAFP